MTDTQELQDSRIDRYLNQHMSEAERAAFELMLLEDEQLFARLQLLDAFKNALADERAALSDAHSPRVAPFRTWLRQPLSLVASLLVCGLGLQVSYGLLAGRSVAPDAAAIDSFILVENTRGAERPPLSAQPPYLFQIDAGPGTANTRVTLDLRAADGRPLLHLAEVPVDGNGWARLVVQQTLSGSYTLEVTAGSGAVLQRFDLSLSE